MSRHCVCKLDRNSNSRSLHKAISMILTIKIVVSRIFSDVFRRLNFLLISDQMFILFSFRIRTMNIIVSIQSIRTMTFRTMTARSISKSITTFKIVNRTVDSQTPAKNYRIQLVDFKSSTIRHRRSSRQTNQISIIRISSVKFFDLNSISNVSIISIDLNAIKRHIRLM